MAHMTRRLCAVLFAIATVAGCGAGGAGGGDLAMPADAQKSQTGLAWKVLKPGTGTDHPAATSLVLVHYTGWRMEDGEKFDSSLDKGQPLEYRANQFIPGWIEGLQLMVKGEKRRFWIPAKLAYEGVPGRPQGMLVFDIELLDFK